uniref:Uncharacterized protein n=1 Tax=Oryza brachyantha TaxID=4533 RepID=J3L1U4_ORYBR
MMQSIHFYKCYFYINRRQNQYLGSYVSTSSSSILQRCLQIRWEAASVSVSEFSSTLRYRRRGNVSSPNCRIIANTSSN